MSLILEALKKLDREKLSRREGTAKIADDILRSDSSHSGKRIPVLLLVILTTVIAVILTYTAIIKFGLLSKSSPPVIANTPPKSQTVAPAPLDSAAPAESPVSTTVSPSLLDQPVSPAPLSREPGRTARDAIKRVPPKTQAPAENRKNEVSAVSTLEKKTEQKRITEQRPVVIEEVKKPIEQPPQMSSTTPPSLTLSGIVWYEEPSKRIAVINGTISNEGTFIQGVKIVEILPDRVRLSYNNQPFEISLGH